MADTVRRPDPLPAARASRPTTRRSVFHRTHQIGIRVALFVAISGLGLTAVSAGQQGTTTGFLDRSIALGGATYRYQVYLPAEYTPEKEWPVLVDLHGNGAQGSDGIRQTAHFLADEIRMHRSRFPLIAVFPQAAVSNSWVTGAMPEMVDAEVGATLREFRIDVDLVGDQHGAE